MNSVRPTKDAVVTAVHVLPFDGAVRPEVLVTGARGSHDRSEFLLVRVETSVGVDGFGEVSATLPWSGEDSTTASYVIDRVLAPAVVGRPLAPIGALEARMDRLLTGHPFTKAGLSIALWDAWSRILDLPMATVLGGPLRDTVPVKCSLSGNGEQLATTYAAAHAAGFRSFKVKIGMDPVTDIARVAQARELLGDSTFLGLDANGGYRRSQAGAVVDAVRRYRPAFLEQPVAAGDLAGMRELRSAGLPVIADESVFGMADLVAVLQAGAADTVSLYVGKSGGPAMAVRMAGVAAAFGVDVLIGSNGELGIGAAAQLQVACAVPELASFPSDIIGALYYQQDVLARPMDLDGVRAMLPDAPGLGVELRADLREGLGCRD